MTTKGDVTVDDFAIECGKLALLSSIAADRSTELQYVSEARFEAHRILEYDAYALTVPKMTNSSHVDRTLQIEGIARPQFAQSVLPTPVFIIFDFCCCVLWPVHIKRATP